MITTNRGMAEEVLEERRCMQDMPALFFTDRLRLRSLSPNDAPALFRECASDPRVTRYLEWAPHGDIAETRTFIENCRVNYAGNGSVRVIVLQENGELIGLASCNVQEGYAGIGYMLGHRHWGKGYAAEAMRALIAWVDGVSGLNGFCAICNDENIASIKVLQRLGFKKGGSIEERIRFPLLDASQPSQVCWYWRGRSKEPA